MSDGFEMNQDIFSNLEIDTIGEIMNISMGSAATAASTVLNQKVTITTPTVNLVPLKDFEIGDFEPAIAVDTQYVEGIYGSNILILRREDMRTILSQMLNKELPEDFEMDAMAESALGELMNQMMGSSATVLSGFLGQTINISTPYTIPIAELDSFKENYFGEDDYILTIEFVLAIEGVIESKFIVTMRLDLAKEIISVSLDFDSQEMPEPPSVEEQLATPQVVEQAQIPSAPPPVAPSQGMPQQTPVAQPPYPPQQQAPYYPPQPNTPYYGAPAPQPQGYGAEGPAMVKEYDFNDFGAGAVAQPDQHTNLDLVMNVPVVVTVELGRTKRKIKEILEFGQGTIVELDKQAGTQVDVIVNGQLIARGDVVVLDDNFSIRITEILKNRDSLALM